MLGPSRLGGRPEEGLSWSCRLLNFLEPEGLGTMSFTQRGRNTEGQLYFKPLLLPACGIPLTNVGPTDKLTVAGKESIFRPSQKDSWGGNSSCLLKSFGMLNTSIYSGLGETCLIRKTTGKMA